MKDTNAIEKALKKKIELEIKEVVAEIVTTIDAKFRQKYNSVSFYDFEKPEEVCAMLSRKTRQLLNKLESTKK